MKAHKALIITEKRILLHLLSDNGPRDEYVPFSLTQQGIALAVGADKSYVSIPIKKLILNGVVQECIGRVKGGKKKQKYYLLTEKGEEYTKKLEKKLLNLQITLRQSDGIIIIMALKNITFYLKKEKICHEITEQNIYNIISNDGILDIEHLKKIKEPKFVDFSDEAPMIVNFFGRKKEMAALEKWIEDKNKPSIFFMHGMAGIGKTTLAAKLIEKYRGTKHLFWYNIPDLGTLRAVLSKLAEFLSKLGDDRLELYLRTRTILDCNKVSRILEKDMKDIDAVLVFDDFHKSNDEMRSFFKYFLRIFRSSLKTKMLILSRETVPFYDRRDVLTRKIVAEMVLEGLDFESSKRLLKEIGIDKSMFKGIYGLTDGNPLFLEIIELKDHLERYMHDELFSKFDEDEKEIMGRLSIYRFPVPEGCLTMYDDFEFEKLYGLTQKSIVKKDAYGRYFIHDIIKQFFYSRLSPSKRKKQHLLAARWYEKKDNPMDLIEAIHHYLEGDKYKKASKFAIENSTYILDGGYAAEFLSVLEKFDEENHEADDWAEILIVKGKACNMIGDCEKVIFFLTKSSEIASTIDAKKIEVRAICELGHILEEQNQFDKAMDCFRKCLVISEKDDYVLGTGESYRGIGRVHWRRSEHEEAVTNLSNNLEISEKLGNSELIASTYTDLGNIYDDRYEIEKAIECYKKSLDILKQVKNSYETARTYANLAMTYRHLEEFDKAIDYYTRNLALAKNLNDIKVIGYGYAGIGYCFAKTDEFKKASKYAKKAENIAMKINNENIMFDIYKTYGLTSKNEERWEDAISYFKRSIDMAKKLNASYQLSDLHFELGQLYSELDDTKNAKKHLKIALNLYNELGLERVKLVRNELSKY